MDKILEYSIDQAFATEDDIQKLAQLGSLTFYQAFGDTTPAEVMADYLQEAFSYNHVLRELSDKRNRFYIGYDKTNPAGYFKMRFCEPADTEAYPTVQKDSAVYLQRFYVLEDYYGKGLSHGLMEACLHQARANGGRSIHLGCWTENYRAQKFYAKYGFQQVGNRIFSMGKVDYDDMILELIL
jgi:diamine N-acetyltransferase